MNKYLFIFFYISVFSAIAQNVFLDVTGPYIGQSPPDLIPEKFAKGIVSTDSSELNSVFTKDGREFYFTRRIGEGLKIFWLKMKGENWTKPEMVSFSKILPKMDEVDMFLSNDESRLYYISNRPTSEFLEKSVNIFYSKRNDSDWSAPILLPHPINTDSIEVYPMIVADGSMYWASQRTGGSGLRDVYRSDYSNGEFTEAINIGPEVNSQYNEGDIYVSPDESYLIVSSWGRPDSFGRSDLYISKNENGRWSKPTNMGEPINSEHTDFCPIVSPDGKYLFFSRNGDIYWVDIQILEKFLNRL